MVGWQEDWYLYLLLGLAMCGFSTKRSKFLACIPSKKRLPQATCEKGAAMPTFTLEVKALGGCVLTLEVIPGNTVKELKTMLLNKKEDSNEDRKYLNLEVQLLADNSWQTTLCYQMMIRHWSLWDFMVNRMSWWFIQEWLADRQATPTRSCLWQ